VGVVDLMKSQLIDLIGLLYGHHSNVGMLG
jgi:hypothetical protein